MNFRTKLLGLAGAVTMLAGLASAQSTVSVTGPISVSATASAGYIRAEGQTELLPQTQLTFNNTAATAGTLSVTLYLSPTVSITSAVTSTSTGATTAVAQIAGANVAFGVPNGSSITFSGIPIAAAIAATTVTFNNIRVNATSIPTVAGAPPTAISVSSTYVNGTNIVTNINNTVVPLGYVANGLLASKYFSDALRANPGKTVVGSPFGVCNSINNGSGTGSAVASFFVSLDSAFQGAFKKQANEAGINAEVTNSGTRLKLVFANIPTGLNVYLPVTVTSTTAFTSGAAPVLTGQISETAATNGTANNQQPVTTPASVNTLGLYQVPVSNNTAVAVYEVTTDNAGISPQFTVPVFLQAATNAITGFTTGTAVTVTTSFAPITGVSTIPSFASGSSTTTLSPLSFSQCTTTLLFPFVSYMPNGFDTGFAIANTSADPFNTKTQSGTCKLNWYGNGTVASANAVDSTGTSVIPAGGMLTFDVPTELQQSATNPTQFQGYVIAQCQFQYAHGFGYVTYGFPGTTAVSEGYLAVVLTRGTSGFVSGGVTVGDSLGN
jgi:hypothetical protein